MNRDQVRGPLLQLRGEAKKLWGALTDNDSVRAEGSSEKLIGIIQQRFGNTKDAIRRKLKL